MSGFYFTSVPRLKIRRGRVVDDFLPPPPVPSAAPVLGVTVLQTPETMAGRYSFIPFAPEVTSEMPSISSLVGSVSPSESFRKLGKRKAGADSREEGQAVPHSFRKITGSGCYSSSLSSKYWTSAFEKAADNAELTELLKLAEMYTSQSHVLNCELYKVLAMKVDELRSTIGRYEDVNVLRSKNNDLRERLAFSEDARARAIYDVTKAKRI
ncbi:hypothetical protein Fot_34864 [Forsythia ovata]|uniref:Uncharacterized protein n=1 Tax=Forsythia ovata TaxID=205694 RepID=A0ABD1SKK0_9LAMI